MRKLSLGIGTLVLNYDAKAPIPSSLDSSARRSGEDHQIKATPGINSAYQKWYNKSMLSRLSVRINMITAYNGEHIRRSFSGLSLKN